jgi:hypothetical protein
MLGQRQEVKGSATVKHKTKKQYPQKQTILAWKLIIFHYSLMIFKPLIRPGMHIPYFPTESPLNSLNIPILSG